MSIIAKQVTGISLKILKFLLQNNALILGSVSDLGDVLDIKGWTSIFNRYQIKLDSTNIYFHIRQNRH